MGWRPLRPEDLPAVLAIAARIHPDFPEDEAVFRERLRLFPAGSRLLAGESGTPLGYLVAHPWRSGPPPALDTLLGEIPPEADLLYIHDIALLPEARGRGAAGEALRSLLALARASGLARLALVAVNGSAPFWTRQGFRIVEDAALAEKLASYGAAARYMTRAA